MILAKPMILEFNKAEYLCECGGAICWVMLWFIKIDRGVARVVFRFLLVFTKRKLVIQKYVKCWEFGYVYAWIFLCDFDVCSPFAFSFIISVVVRHSGF